MKRQQIRLITLSLKGLKGMQTLKACTESEFISLDSPHRVFCFSQHMLCVLLIILKGVSNYKSAGENKF